jgi:hypothetical protein
VALGWPLCHPVLWPLVLHHPSWGQGRDCLCQPAPSPAQMGMLKQAVPMPWPTARHWHRGQAGHRLPRRSTCTQAGLVYRLPVSRPSCQEQPGEHPGTVFFQTHGGGGGALPRRLLLPSLHSSGTRSDSGDRQQGSTSDLTSSEVSPREGVLWRAWLHPWTHPVPAGWCTAPCGVHPATSAVNNLPVHMYIYIYMYIPYSAMYSVINWYCPNCCPYCPSQGHRHRDSFVFATLLLSFYLFIVCIVM